MDLTQAELATFLNVSPRTVVNWETSGVPESKVARIMPLIKPHLSEAEYVAEIIKRDSERPEPSDEEFARWAAQQQQGPPEPEQFGMSATQRRSHLLKAFSDVDLLNELKSRALRRGERASHWNAERMERYQKFVAPTWADDDPDYSNMSEADAMNYGLAAFKGEDNIAHDELPHEP